MIDPEFKSDLSFNSYTKYMNNGQYDSNHNSQYNNFSNEMINYNNDIRYSSILLQYLNKNTLNDNDKRQMEINNYYISKYNNESNILKQIIFFCCMALVGSLFFLNGLISESLYIVYVSLIIFIGCMNVFYSIYNLYLRDNIVFDEYEYKFMNAPGKDMSYIPITKENKQVDIKKCL
jgi:hypothetical protein